MSEPNDPGSAPEPSVPRAPWWRRRIALAAAGVAVVLIGGGIIAVRAVGGAPAGPADLPSPPGLAHDPVPVGRVAWTVPKSCGVSGKTLDRLTPGGSIGRDGDRTDGGTTCEWRADSTSKRGARTLTVTLSLVRAPDVPVTGGTSPIAAAIDAFANRLVTMRSAVTPLRGLGDEAVLTGATDDGHDSARGLLFRTGNTVVNVEYRAGTDADGLAADTTVTPKTIRAALTRAGADIARSLGAPAAPVPAAAAPAVKVPALPGHICATVPKDLRDRLIGGDDDDAPRGNADGEASHSDPLIGGDATITAARTTNCTWDSYSRTLTAVVTIAGAGDPGTALRDASRNYLRRYYALRDDRPLSVHDARDFRPLAGVGDEGFCSYLEESGDPADDARSPARCVIRSGAVLVTVTYGSISDRNASDDADHRKPLTPREAINGAYAAARPVLRSATR